MFVGQILLKDSKIFIGTIGLIIVGCYKIVWKYSTIVYNYRGYKVLEAEMEYYWGTVGVIIKDSKIL